MRCLAVDSCYRKSRKAFDLPVEMYPWNDERLCSAGGGSYTRRKSIVVLTLYRWHRQQSQLRELRWFITPSLHVSLFEANIDSIFGSIMAPQPENCLQVALVLELVVTLQTSTSLVVSAGIRHSRRPSSSWHTSVSSSDFQPSHSVDFHLNSIPQHCM